MEFYSHHVAVGTVPPPEELLASIVGSIGLWQKAVIIVGFILQFLAAMSSRAVQTAASDNLNFTCKDGNGTKCENINGTRCENFEFVTLYNVITFTEKLSLVCERKRYTLYIRTSDRSGRLLGSFVAGYSTIRLGGKKTLLMFLPLQSLGGFFMINMNKVEILLIFVFLRGFFCSASYIVPKLAVCSSVGNNWRTLAISILVPSHPLSYIVFPSIFTKITRVETLIAIIGVLPLILLVPLLYYEDCPDFVGKDIKKEERVLRKISNINKRPMSEITKICPVQVIRDSTTDNQNSFFDIWKPTITRNGYMALVCLNFFNGYYFGILMNYVSGNLSYLSSFGVSGMIGIMIGTLLCHFVSHKIIIAAISFIRNLFIGGVLMYDVHWNDTSSFKFLALIMISGIFFYISFTTCLTLQMRMLLTEWRPLILGFFNAAFEFGFISSTYTSYYANKYEWIIPFTLIVSAIIEILSCCALWNVHNRELPDFLDDCVRFERFYKPTRYFQIFYKRSQDEIEVKRVHLNDFNRKKKQRRKDGKYS